MSEKFANPIVFGMKDLFRVYDLDSFWIKSLPVIRHLTGFTGSTAQLLLAGDDKKYLLVDSRYTTQAGSECPGAEVREIKLPVEDTFALAAELGVKRIGFEAQAATYANYQTMLRVLPNAEKIAIDENLDCLRIIKTPAELENMRKAFDLHHKASLKAMEASREGASEFEVAWVFERTCRELGAQKLSFDTLVCSGARSAIVHGKPSEKKFVAGDFVIFDRGVELNGWCSDETNTFVVGKPSERHKEIYQIVQDAHDFAMEAVKPGAKCVEVDAVARNFIANKGYAEYFGHGLGHGVGLLVHEMPRISPLGQGELLEGMVLTIEPGIYIPGWGGVRVEDTVVVTANGCETLTKAEKKLLEI